MDTTKKELYTAKRPSGLDTSVPEIQSLVEQLRSDADPLNWLLLKANGATLAVHGSGAGGLAEFSSSLTDDEVLYGALRCTVDGKVRFFHIYFVGQNVSALKKGKASMYKSAVFGLIDAQGEIPCTGGMEEYSEELIKGSIAKLTGSASVDM
jgi:hypothetical protein